MQSPPSLRRRFFMLGPLALRDPYAGPSRASDRKDSTPHLWQETAALWDFADYSS